MGRKNRGSILFDGCWAHVFSRATEKKYIFREEADFKKFKDILLEAKTRHEFKIHHYCLMSTHFHIVVSIPSVQQFSEGLKWVKWSYARYFNLKNRRFGPLWRDRFKSLVIEDERYLRACGQYVEANPVEAGMVNRCEDWAHSSSRYYLRKAKDTLVDGYTFNGEPLVVAGNREEYFTKGHVIGSELFKIHCQEEFFQSLSVPS